MLTLPKQPNQYSAPLWNQTNDSDINGSLWASFNLDFSENEGRLRLGKRLVVNTNTAVDAGFTSTPIGFKLFTYNNGGTTSIFTVIGANVWSMLGDYPNVSIFSQDGGSGTPTTCSATTSDIEIFNAELYVTANDGKAYYLAYGGTTWANIASVGTAGEAIMMAPYGARMYYGSGITVLSSDTSHSLASSGAYTISLPGCTINDTRISFIKAGQNRIWIGTVNILGQRGRVYEWDGSSTQPTKFYTLQAGGALACVIKDDIPYVMDSNARMWQFNGGTFVKVAQLNRRNKKMLTGALDLTNSRFIHPNGMALINSRINLLINGKNADNAGSMEETIPSGLWEYDEERGLIHKGSFSTTRAVQSIVDYGAPRISGIGGLAEIDFPDTASGKNGTFMAGATYFTSATATSAAAFYDDSNDTLQKAGYLISTKLSATDENGQPSVQGSWPSIYTLYKQLQNATDEIAVKYRVYEKTSTPVEVTITWTSTTTFTVLNSAVDVSQYWTAGTGGEIEITAGVGAGQCSHIINAVINAGTWTVTVDETYVGASSQTAKARFENWVKLSEITYNNSIPSGVTYSQDTPGVISNWIQFKIYMIFTGKNELEKLLIANVDYNKAD